MYAGDGRQNGKRAVLPLKISLGLVGGYSQRFGDLLIEYVELTQHGGVILLRLLLRQLRRRKVHLHMPITFAASATL